jgi:hypothetical protein
MTALSVSTMRRPKWKKDAIASLEASIAFFSNANKLNREKYVVTRLLEALGVDFHENELTAAEEPADVKFRKARFQVKEVMQAERQRMTEYVEELARVRKAKRRTELLTQYAPIDASLREIVDRSVERSRQLVHKYGPRERQNLDLVCYFNFLGVHEVLASFDTPTQVDFRSLSVVSNRFRLVLYAQSGAPPFLRDNIERVCEVNPID